MDLKFKVGIKEARETAGISRKPLKLTSRLLDRLKKNEYEDIPKEKMMNELL